MRKRKRKNRRKIKDEKEWGIREETQPSYE